MKRTESYGDGHLAFKTVGLEMPPRIVSSPSNRDRTGIVLAYYRCAAFGVSPEEGIARARNIRPEALDASAPGWEDMTLQVARQLLGKL